MPPAGPLPERFGRYRILRPLGHGGMGSVWLAHDTELDRPVALKVPRFAPEEGAVAVERFRRSARAAATLTHPNLCPVFDVGQHQGTPYLTMPYVEGRSLAEILRDGPLPVTQAVELVARLASGLQQAHSKGVVHRDLNAGNVIVREDGEPVLVDFGLARSANTSRLTVDGQVLGTPGYLAPEQLSGESERHGPASDVYGLGVLLYELLTGRLPFGRTLREVLVQEAAQTPTPPSALRSEVGPALDGVCLKAMARRSQDRFVNMEAFAAALRHCLSPNAEVPAPRPTPVRPRIPVWALAAVAVMVGGALLWLLWPSGLPRAAVQPIRPAPGLLAELFQGMNFERRLKTRIDSTLDFALGPGAIDPDVPEDCFSVRWTGWLKAPRPGRCTLLVEADDGVRLWLDDKLLIDEWRWQNRRRFDATVELSDRSHPLRIEYFEGWGHAFVRLWWKLEDGAEQPVPAKALEHDPTAAEAAFAKQQPEPPRWQRHALDARAGPVHGIAWLPDGKRLLSVGADGAVRLWDAETGAEQRKLTSHRGPALAVAVSPDGTRAVSGGVDRTLRHFSLDMDRPAVVLPGHTDAVRQVAFLPNGREVLSAGDDGTLRRWNLDDRREVGEPWKTSRPLRAMAVAHDGTQVVVGSTTPADRPENVTTDGPIRIYGLRDSLQAVALTSDGTRGLYARGDIISVRELATDREVHQLRGHHAKPFAVACTHDGRRGVTGSPDTTVRVWDLGTGLEVRCFVGHTAAVNAVVVAPEGRRVASCGDDGTVRIWEMP